MKVCQELAIRLQLSRSAFVDVNIAGTRYCTGSGERKRTSTSERKRLEALKLEVEELRRANEILRLASGFSAQADLHRSLKP